VAEAIREEVATFLAESVKDPRVVGLVTVTGVDVTRDLRHAKVFVSVMGTDSERAATFQGLDSVAGHLRSRVGRALRLRLATEITFRPTRA
jgi:ribosome-binding factor A